MILIACVDDSMGMTFNHRRQSRDAVLCRDLLSLVQGSDRLSIGVRKLAPTDHKIRHLLHCQCGDKFLHADTPLLDIDQGAAAEITRKPDHFLLVSFSCIGIVKGISQILIQILSLRCI